MTYDSTDDLPGELRESLPTDAQELYVRAYNEAYGEYSDPDVDTGDASPRERAHEDAMDAVEEEYDKEGDEWVQKGGGGMQYS